jgi:hypothetical protein
MFQRLMFALMLLLPLLRTDCHWPGDCVTVNQKLILPLIGGPDHLHGVYFGWCGDCEYCCDWHYWPHPHPEVAASFRSPSSMTGTKYWMWTGVVLIQWLVLDEVMTGLQFPDDDRSGFRSESSMMRHLLSQSHPHPELPQSVVVVPVAGVMPVRFVQYH